jgi:hypothetical protein
MAYSQTPEQIAATGTVSIGYPSPGGVIGAPGQGHYYSPETRSPSLLGMIAMRLRIPEGYPSGFEFINAHRVGDTVNVFIIAKDDGSEAIILKDDWNLFPSDALITQLRLIRK